MALSSEHAAAVAIQLRQRVRRPGEVLHVLRDDIYERVAVAHSDRTEAEQDLSQENTQSPSFDSLPWELRACCGSLGSPKSRN